MIPIKADVGLEHSADSCVFSERMDNSDHVLFSVVLFKLVVPVVINHIRVTARPARLAETRYIDRQFLQKASIPVVKSEAALVLEEYLRIVAVKGRHCRIFVGYEVELSAGSSVQGG